MKKASLSAILFTTILTSCFSQNVYFVAGGNLSIGGQYRTLEHIDDYTGEGNVYYSPGGGMGVEFGVQWEFVRNLRLQSTLGYQQQYAFERGWYIDGHNESVFSFNRKFLTAGLVKSVRITKDAHHSLILGAGIHYNVPGSLKRKENNIDLGFAEYENSFGHFFEVGVRLEVGKYVLLEPKMKFRRLQLQAEYYSQGMISDLPRGLQQMNANGLEFGFTLVTKI